MSQTLSYSCVGLWTAGKGNKGLTHTAIEGQNACNIANVSIAVSVLARIVQIQHNGKADAFCMYVVLKQRSKYKNYNSFLRKFSLKSPSINPLKARSTHLPYCPDTKTPFSVSACPGSSTNRAIFVDGKPGHWKRLTTLNRSIAAPC